MTAKWRRRFLVVFGLGMLLLTVILWLVGPWPTYRGDYHDKPFFERSVAALEERIKSSGGKDGEPTGFLAGWARRSIAPPIGTPLAGYGARKGRGCTRIRDDVFVKALAVSDGEDLAVVVGSDMLIVPENVADRVRKGVAEQTALNGEEILFNASHNHSGPGGFAPGAVSGLFNGPYQEGMPDLLTEAFVEAIVEALGELRPAGMFAGGTSVPELIRNRERDDGAVDSELSFLLIEQDTGDRCILVSYSAHPTVIGSDNFEITGSYPGFLMSALGQMSQAEVIYLGGAVGSMGHRAPEGDSEFDRSERMGRALAERVWEALSGVDVARRALDVAAIGFPMEIPPFQLRLNRNWRLSSQLLPLLGIDHDAWLQGVRLGDVVLVGTPADYCGEISVGLKVAAAEQGLDLWVLSFNGDYVGYISPDAYYDDLEADGTLGYERGVMSWIGPQQEAYTRDLIERLVQGLF